MKRVLLRKVGPKVQMLLGSIFKEGLIYEYGFYHCFFSLVISRD